MICEGSRLLHLDNRVITASGTGVIARGGCELYITNSRISALGTALTEKERIVCTTRTGQQTPGVRVSPHFYNTMDEMDRAVGAIKKYLAG